MDQSKHTFSRRLLRAVFYMQAFVFVCICLLKYNLDVFSLNYRNIETKATTAIVNLEELSSLLYKHETVVSNYAISTKKADIKEEYDSAKEIEEEIQGVLIKCDLALEDIKDFKGYELFDDLSDSVEAYVNCANLILDIKDTNSQKLIFSLLSENLSEYTERANEDMSRLIELAREEYNAVEELSYKSVTNSRAIFIWGIFVFFLGTIIFISYMRNVMEAQEQYTELAESANRAKTAFLSSMSHEIRTPINAIIGMNEMISRETGDTTILDYSDKIKASSESLLELVNDVLDFSKIEAGKMELIPESYNLKTMLTEIWDMIYVRASEKGLKLEAKVDANVPVELFGDSLRIKQIILNLLTNAVKYTESGSITLSVEYFYKSDEEILLRTSVKDTGIGLNPEEIDKLTRPFERIDEKRSRNIEGAGLGLSIVKNLLSLMESKLEVDSIYGTGSTFAFEVAQKVEKWTKMGNFAPSERRASDRAKDTAILNAHRANILAVDDNELNRMVIKELLKRTGVNLTLAEGGAESVELCKKEKYDAILMDHRMPDIDGVEALHMIKEEGLNKETPAIVITANANNGMDDFYKSEGFEAFLSKPIDGVKLERMLLNILPGDLIDSKDDIATLIDEAQGIQANGSEELYEKVSAQFAKTADAIMNELRLLYETGNIKDYTIKIHALKSAAKLVGAMNLSKEAEYLEKCGNEGNIEEIDSLTNDCLSHFKTVAEKLVKRFNLDEEKQKESFDRDKMCELLSAMAEGAEAFDFDLVDRALEEGDSMEVPALFSEKWTKIKDAVYAVDREVLMELSEDMRGGLLNYEG